MAKQSVLVKEPVYQQLHQVLRDIAGSTTYRDGQKFLTERQIVSQFGVSRPTANKALAALVGEGVLEFRKGVGTFVREQKLDYDIRSLVSFTHKAQSAGKDPATTVLDFAVVSARSIGKEIASALSLPNAAKVYRMKRLRLADDVPVILEYRWVSAALCPALSASDVEGSIYSLFVHKYSLPITAADQVINAVNLQSEDASLLQVKRGTAGFLVSATGFSRRTPLWVERTLYRGDAYEFHHHRPAGGRLIVLK